MIKYAMLKLSKNSYVNDLRGTKPPNFPGTYVFQFMLSAQDDIYPKLSAYRMGPGHSAVTPPVYVALEYVVPNPTAHLSILGPQVLGDLQIARKDLEELLIKSNADPFNFDYLQFTPILQNDYDKTHILYQVSVVPSTISPLVRISLELNPSPPRGAE